MDNIGPSLIRTYVPIIVAAIVTFLAAHNITLDPEHVAALSTLIGGLAGAVYYTVVRFLERKFPWVGKFLGSAKKPVYTNPDATPPYTVADLEKA